MEWVLILAWGFLSGLKAKEYRSKAKEHSPSQWEHRCYMATIHLEHCLPIQEKPSWHYDHNKKTAQRFCNAVRDYVEKDGYPLPNTQYGNDAFDALSLTFARGMECAGGSREEQIRFAALYHKHMIGQKTADVYDNPQAHV